MRCQGLWQSITFGDKGLGFCVYRWRVGWLVYGFWFFWSQIQPFLLSLLWDFELLCCWSWRSQYEYSAADQQTFRSPLFFNLMPFSALLVFPGQHTASPPSFSKSPLKALLKARSGSEVTLECKPQASPPAISLWKKGSEILQRTER